MGWGEAGGEGVSENQAVPEAVLAALPLLPRVTLPEPLALGRSVGDCSALPVPLALLPALTVLEGQGGGLPLLLRVEDALALKRGEALGVSVAALAVPPPSPLALAARAREGDGKALRVALGVVDSVAHGEGLGVAGLEVAAGQEEGWGVAQGERVGLRVGSRGVAVVQPLAVEHGKGVGVGSGDVAAGEGVGAPVKRGVGVALP